MRKTALVFWRTYWDNVTRRAYLFFTFGLPALFVLLPLLLLGIGYVAVLLLLPANDTRPVGVVDQGSVFLPAGAGDTLHLDSLLLRPFPGREAAAEALEAGDIQVYYEIAPTYWESGIITATAITPPNPLVESGMRSWLLAAVRSRVSPALLARYEQEATIVHEGAATEEGRVGSAGLGNWFLMVLLIYFARTGSVFTSGYMYDSIAREARERTMEILLTSVTLTQFIVGKLSALLLVGLTQIATWAGLPLLFLWGYEQVRGGDLFSRLWQWELLPLVVVALLGAYVLDQMAAAALGILRVSGGAGPQLFNAASWLMGLSLVYGSYFLPRNPHSPAAVAASLFPFTAPIILPIRAAASEVPAWQAYLGLGLLWATNLAAVLILRRLLRLNLVAYAERFQMRRWLWRTVGERVLRPVAGRLRRWRGV